MSTVWLDLPSHHLWLQREHLRLLDFGRRIVRPGGGASYLGEDADPDHDEPLTPFHTARVVHALGLGALVGVPGCRSRAVHVLAGLTGPLHDDTEGGWFHRGEPELDQIKDCYDHVHVLLGASTARQVGLPGSDELYQEASSLVLDRFWDPGLGLLRDSYDRGWETPAPYLGANANMHGLEAMLAAYDVCADPGWLERGERIARFFAAVAENFQWRLPEHYHSDATVWVDFNRDRPEDPFKPYGATIGHALEWSRLMLHLEAALLAAGRPAEGLERAARGLVERAVRDGWAVDGSDGFVYTTDFDGTAITRTRLWWVVCEAIAAAACWYRRTGEQRFADWYQQWWDYAARYLIDQEQGGWHHELDSDNQVGHRIWAGKPDLYHTTQACLVPRLPLAPGLAKALRQG